MLRITQTAISCAMSILDLTTTSENSWNHTLVQGTTESRAYVASSQAYNGSPIFQEGATALYSY